MLKLNKVVKFLRNIKEDSNNNLDFDNPLDRSLYVFSRGVSVQADALLGCLYRRPLSNEEKISKVKNLKDKVGHPLSFILFMSRFERVAPVLGLINIYARDNYDNNTFHYMSTYSSEGFINRIEQVVSGLVKLGLYGELRALVDDVNIMGKTPIDLANQSNNTSYISLLNSIF